MDNLNQDTQVMEVTENAKKYLKTMSSWTNFMAILSFIGIGFMVLSGLWMLNANIDIDTMFFGYLSWFYRFMGVFYIVTAVIMILPVLYLLRFSQKTKQALVNQDSLVMEDAFKNMKDYWKFLGIFTIVMIALCIIATIIAIGVVAATMM